MVVEISREEKTNGGFTDNPYTLYKPYLTGGVAAMSRRCGDYLEGVPRLPGGGFVAVYINTWHKGHEGYTKGTKGFIYFESAI
jgi:hypothetical protein